MKVRFVLALIIILCLNIIGCNKLIQYNPNLKAVINSEHKGIYESKEVYGKKEADRIKEVLDDYGDKKDLQVSKALKKNLVVIEDKEFIGNENIWDSFYYNSKNKKEDSVTIVKYTEQGDPILTYLSYKNNEYFMVEDESRDRYDENQEDYYEYNFRYLCMFEDNNFEYAYLLDDNEITLNELNYSLSSSDESKWIPYGFIFYTNKS